jgi:ElaB/YqjD/DUF883 family membrane-anchored ribosome-binding protein
VVQDQGSTGAQTLAGQAQEKMQETGQQAKGAVSRVVSERVETASGQAASQLGDLTSAFRRTSHQLRGEGKDQPAKVVEAVSDRTDRVAQYLSSSSSSQILDDLERLGRTRPWVAIAGGLAAGFVAARLLKASSSRRFDDWQARYPDGYPQRSYPPTARLPVVPAAGAGDVAG